MIRNRAQYQVNTVDINSNRGIGIALPFNPTNIFTINYTTKDQIKSNLLNFMLTNRGERPFNPDFGADLRSLLFDPMTDLTFVKNDLRERIIAYFPEIIVRDVIFTPDVDNSYLNIKLIYSFRNQDDTLVIQII
jgi:phage baseplate assembly protein W